jgi:short-subunit dehydrogenase
MIGSTEAPQRRWCWLAVVAAVGLTVAGAVWYDLRRPSPAAFRARYGPAAFVAGASEGLGAAWAEYAAARGLDLVLVARHIEPLDAVATRLRATYGVAVETHALDLASADAAQYAAELFGARADIRLLVYNAAYTGYSAGYFVREPLEWAHTAVDVNIKGVLSLAHPFLAERRTRGESGGLVLMSSMAGLVGSAHLSVYASTKAWDTAFATGLYEELRADGIDVLSCIAGATTTPNYLAEALPGRSTFIEQTPAAVVDECAGALGKAPTRATGLVNRFAQALMTRLLPTFLAVRIISDGALQTTHFEEIGPGAEGGGRH